MLGDRRKCSSVEMGIWATSYNLCPPELLEFITYPALPSNGGVYCPHPIV